MKDYYKILGLSNTASQEEIKQKYRELAKKWHPDANGEKKEYEEKFKALNEAYSVLSSPSSRMEYDANRKSGGEARRSSYSDYAKNEEWEFRYYRTRREQKSDFSPKESARWTIAKGALQVVVGIILFPLPGFFPMLGLYSVFSGVSNIKRGLSRL